MNWIPLAPEAIHALAFTQYANTMTDEEQDLACELFALIMTRLHPEISPEDHYEINKEGTAYKFQTSQ